MVLYSRAGKQLDAAAGTLPGSSWVRAVAVQRGSAIVYLSLYLRGVVRPEAGGGRSDRQPFMLAYAVARLDVSCCILIGHFGGRPVKPLAVDTGS
jgi:hypothetical protein